MEVAGKVEGFLKLIPIVEVATLKMPKRQMVLKENRYYFIKDSLYLDFANQPQLSAIISGSDVNVLYEDKVIVSIERFLCGVVMKKQNCAALIENYQTNQRDNFDSLRGYTYYRHSTGVWITFDGEKYGYVFKNIDDTMMTMLSSMIKIVNKDFVITNKLSNIHSKCSSQK
jgi:hypothetical protein